LFIGTGDLAQSMLPMFKSTELGIWNYREPLRQPAFPARCFLPGDAEQAARWADCAILTTPADDTNDRLWARLSSWYNIDRVAHLGIRDNRLGHWSSHPEFFCLDDVFRLRQSQSNVRSLHLKRARNACRELATRRAGESRFTSMDGQHPRRALG
jgi:hypothetical protein